MKDSNLETITKARSPHHPLQKYVMCSFLHLSRFMYKDLQHFRCNEICFCFQFVFFPLQILVTIEILKVNFLCRYLSNTFILNPPSSVV